MEHAVQTPSFIHVELSYSLPARAAPTTARRLPGCTPKLTFDRDVLDAKCFDGSRVLHAEASDGGGAVV